eukprot:2313317-Pleurochrysis_carterae.AAC.3
MDFALSTAYAVQAVCHSLAVLRVPSIAVASASYALGVLHVGLFILHFLLFHACARIIHSCCKPKLETNTSIPLASGCSSILVHARSCVWTVAGDFDEVKVDARIDSLVQSAPVVMFSFTSCPFCKKAKEALDSRGITYRHAAQRVLPDFAHFC